MEIKFKILMDSVEDYARQWAKREKEDVDTLSEWIKAVRSLIQIRIKKLNGSINAHATSIFKTQMLLNTYPTSMINMLLSPQTKPQITSFLSVKVITLIA